MSSPIYSHNSPRDEENEDWRGQVTQLSHSLYTAALGAQHAADARALLFTVS